MARAAALGEQLVDVEHTLIALRLTGTGQDGVRYPARIVGRLGHLANSVQVADFRPTDAEGEVELILRERLERARAALDALVGTELADFNRMLAERKLSPVITDAG